MSGINYDGSPVSFKTLMPPPMDSPLALLPPPQDFWDKAQDFNVPLSVTSPIPCGYDWQNFDKIVLPNLESSEMLDPAAPQAPEDSYQYSEKPQTPASFLLSADDISNRLYFSLAPTFLRRGLGLLKQEARAYADIATGATIFHTDHDALDEQSCVVITGASRGLGEELARKIIPLAKGTIVLVARSNDALTKLKADLAEKTTARIVIVPHDLSTKDAGNKLANKLISMNLVPTILVNNAGVSNNKNAIETNPQEFLRELNVNYTSQVQLILALGTAMEDLGKKIKRHTKIICVGSLACITGFAGNSQYGASRAAMLTFLRSYRWEVSPTHPTMHYIAFGQIDTEASYGYRSPFVPRLSAKQASRYLEDAVTSRNPGFLVVPGWSTKLTKWAHALFPTAIEFAQVMVTGALVSVRQRQKEGSPQNHYLDNDLQ